MAPWVIIGEHVSEFCGPNNALQIAIMTEKSRGAGPRASRTPSNPERVLV